MLGMWGSGCQCLLNIVVIFEPLRCLFHKAVPPLFQSLKLSTLPYLYLWDIMFVYIDSYGPKTVLMTLELHPVRYWLLREFYPMTSECHQIRQRCITCWVIKQVDFLTNCTIRKRKFKPCFPLVCLYYRTLPQSRTRYYVNQWAAVICSYLNQCLVLFWRHGVDSLMIKGR